jgi:DNA-binding NarL/FixJ family response regulator
MIVIATKPQTVRCEVSAEHRERFLAMLPQICKQAGVACRMLGTEAKEEFVQSVVAAAYAAFVRLVELDKEDIAYATPLAQFGIKHVRCGRTVGTRLNVRDIGSPYAQIARGFLVERLDRRYGNGLWKEILVEDHRAGPAETAAARIDIAAWFASLPRRNRAVASALASGDATCDVAEKYELSKSRVSQLRNELRTSWLDFQGELPEVLAKRAGQATR